ncbi:neprilysin-4-like [Asterias rubens]|uniref:neprilysin-4-like n=1 Tax=Asterias rubens TaxID=7604 RepID=UPI001455B1F4|nr:neprilysin-4-like [Asterias rubens]
MNTEKNGKNLEYLSMEESQEVMVKGKDFEEGRGKKPPRSGGRRSWFRQRSSLEKFLLFFLLVLLIICVVLLICLIVTVASSSMAGGGTSSRLSTEGICTTPECVISAGGILRNMDMEADPCEDFYQYACGGWTQANFIPDEDAKYTVFEELFNQLMDMSRGLLKEKTTNDSEAVSKAKDFYASCINEVLLDEFGAQPLLDLLDVLGGWPVIAGESWDEDSWDLVEVLSKNRLELDYNFLFAHKIIQDITNSDMNIMMIDQPMLGLEERTFYLDETDKTHFNAYQTYMVDMATALRPDHDREEAKRQMNDALEFERVLANFTASIEMRRDVTKFNNRYTVKKLKDEMPQIDWLRYFQLVHKEGFLPEEELLNFSPHYFGRMASFIHETPKRTVANYLMWRVVDYMNEYLGSELREIRQQFLWITKGNKRERTRWKVCFENTNSLFGMAVGALFVRKHFDERSRSTAQEMVADIRATLIETIKDVSWMDEQTKELALRKASKIKERIGYGDILKDEEAVNDAYKSIAISPTEYFVNVREMWRSDAIEDLAKYGKPVHRGAWKKSPIVVNAYYTPQDNEISFPAGIFQPPFYSNAFPMAMNYGGIGMVIGHELMHGFDDKGRHFDDEGNVNQWFSNSSLQAYNERKECFIDQYSNYYVPEVDKYINGKKTQGEVLADNGGIKEAFLAYKKWEMRHGGPGATLPGLDLTHDQLFYLNFAQIWCSLHRKEELLNIITTDSHPPEQSRVVGTLSNSEYFAEAYQCKKGSAMVRDKPCKLW